MGPEIATHRGVEIRYGYSIHDDQVHAHFVLPQKNITPGFQCSVSTHMSPTPSEGKHHVTAHDEAELLKRVRAAIDRYLDD